MDPFNLAWKFMKYFRWKILVEFDFMTAHIIFLFLSYHIIASDVNQLVVFLLNEIHLDESYVHVSFGHLGCSSSLCIIYFKNSWDLKFIIFVV